jgi:hypothetical protein
MSSIFAAVVNYTIQYSICGRIYNISRREMTVLALTACYRIVQRTMCLNHKCNINIRSTFTVYIFDRVHVLVQESAEL